MVSTYRIERDRGSKESRQQFAVLRKKWPLAFPVKQQDVRPLAIGAAGEIGTAMGWSHPYTLGVLAGWKMAPVYCRAVLCYDQRIALDGSPADPVGAEAKDLAAKQLATLRDVFFLRHGGDDPGPAGRMPVAWRGLDRSAILALWLADAALAARLKWPRPLPLIAGALMHPSLRSGGHRPYPGDPNWTRSCCVAYGRAAVQACDLFAELGRSSQKLIAVAPRLRARGAGAVIETLLNEDAVPAAARRGAISARGSRRLFDRLVALGGVRELTGRSTFRLYGL